MKRRKHVVRVVYKSGASIDVKCNEFNIKRGAGGGVKFEWKDAWPNPLLLGADDVAAVWQVK